MYGKSLNALLQDLQDPAAWRRREAARALGELGDTRAVEPLIHTLRHDKASSVRWEAARALGKLGDTRAVGPLIHALQHDEHEWVRRAAALALGALGDARALEALNHALQHDENWWVRQAVARALGALGDARTVPSLLSALQDGSPEVRAAAAQALGRLSVRTGRIELALQAIAVDVDEAFKGISAAVSKGEGKSTISRRLLEVLRRHPTVRNNQDLLKKITELSKQLFRCYEQEIS